MQPIARWLLFLTNFLLVLYALVQVAGRLLVPWVSTFEDEINSVLASRHIRIEGLEARWSILNPVISAQRISLPAGDLDDIAVQPDLLESAFRGTVVLRRANVASGHIALARDERGWWLAGMERGNGKAFDLTGLLTESDELSAGLDLTFLGSASPAAGTSLDEASSGARNATLHASVRAINRGGRNRLNADLRNAGNARSIAVFRLDRSRGIPLIRPPGHRGVLSVHEFVLPRPLLRGGMVRLNSIEGVWRVQDGQGAGDLSVESAELAFGGSRPFEVSSELGVWSSGWQWGLDGNVSAGIDDQQVTIENIVVRHEDERIDARIEKIDGNALLAVARIIAAPVEKVDRWLTGLNADGEVVDAWGFVRLDGDEDASWRFGFGGKAVAASTAAFNGVPQAAGVEAELFGYDHGFLVRVSGDDLQMGFPDMFAAGWHARDAAGDVQVFFRPGYSAVRGTGLRARTGSLEAMGSFAVTNPELPARKGLILLVDADQAEVAEAKAFLPRTMEAKLLSWLDQGPRSGRLSGLRFAFQGQNKSQGIDFARRVEIRADIESMEISYHADWPLLSEVAGDLAVEGNDVTFNARAGRSMGMQLEGSGVRITDRGGRASVDLLSRADAADYLAFVRASPLQARVPFVRPEWSMGGSMQLQGRIVIPLRTDPEHPEPVHASLQGALSGVSADLPDLRLSFAGLTGPVSYESPHAVASPGLTGTLWGEPVDLTIEPGKDHVMVAARGEMTVPRALQIAALGTPGFAQGRFSYESDIAIAAEEGATTEISLRSDLAGVDLGLPEGLGRKGDDATPSSLDLQILKGYSVVAFQYRDVQGWLHVGGRPLRGAIGIGTQPPLIEAGEDLVSIGGRIRHAHLEAWTRLFAGAELQGEGRERSAAPDRSPAWRIDGLRIERAFVGDLGFDDLELDGQGAGRNASFGFSARDVEGHVTLVEDAPMDLRIVSVRLPAAPEASKTQPTPEMLRMALGPVPDDDPLDESLIRKLPEMNVAVDQIWRGDEDYGRWRFNVRKPAEDTLSITSLEATIKGLTINAAEGVRWTAGDDLTTFKGNLRMGDLAEVLPAWRYAASVASESATLDADVTWSGSPLNLSVAHMAGSMTFAARNGRFLEVESGSGAMRIMSLFSFSAILKRLNFNFSDVIGRGVGFETLDTRVQLGNGLLTFTQPMEVKSTSSDFRLGGSVNMHTGVLENELILTLPVSKNLPWYGLYIALANPLVGLGVIVGERVLRKPLEQFSSAKYVVRGTLTDPDVRFVELFDTRLSEPAAGTAGETAEPVAEQASTLNPAADAIVPTQTEIGETD